MNQCRTHHAPWRSKGYFLIEDSGDMVAKLTTFNSQPEGLESGYLSLEEGDRQILIQADYLV